MPDTKSAAIEQAQKEIRDLEQLKKMALERKIQYSFLAPSIDKELKTLDKELNKAKKELAGLTSASDLVSTDEVRSRKEKRKERRKKRKAKRKERRADRRAKRKERRVENKAKRKKRRRNFLDKVKGFIGKRVVGFIGRKVEDIIGDKIEGFLIEKVENLLEGQVSGLIDKAIGMLPDLPGGDFVKNATESLLKDSNQIVKDEIIAYINGGGLAFMIDAIKESAGEVLNDGLQSEDAYQLLRLAYEKVKDSGQIQDVVERIKDRIVDRFFLMLEGMLDQAIGRVEEFLIKQLKELMTGKANELVDLAISQLANVPGGDFVANATERLLKDSNAIIEDELTKYIQGGGIRDIVLSFKEHVQATLADGAQGSDVTAVLKGVYEEIKASGDFQTITQNVKERIVARFKLFLEDLLDAAVEKVEDFLIEKLDTLLNEQAPQLIDVAIGKLKEVPGGDFIANATETLMKDSATIINDELRAYIEGGGIKRIVDITKDEVMAAVANGAQGADVTKVLTGVYEKVKTSGDFQSVINSVKAKITARFLQALEELLGAAVEKVEEFLKEKLAQLLLDQAPQYIDLGIQKLQNVPGADFVANATETLLKDSAAIVNEELAAFIGGGGIERIVMTTKDEVLAQIADGAQASDIQKVLVNVYETIKASGDFQTVVNTIKDRIVDRFYQAVEEIIDKAVEQVEDFVVEQLEELLLGAVPDLIDRAVDMGKSKVGSFPGADFVANVTTRISKESAAIVNEEIEAYIKSGGIRQIVTLIKDGVLEEVANGLDLGSVSTITKSVYEGIKSTGDFQNMLTSVKDKIIDAFIEIIEDELEDAIAGPVDEFLERYGTYNGELLSTGRQEIPVGTFWGAVTIEANMEATISAKLESKRENLGIKASAGLAADTYAGVGVQLGYDIPKIGGISMTGLLQGGVEVKAMTSLSMELKQGALKGALEPASLGIDLASRLGFTTSPTLPSWLLEQVPVVVKDIKVSGDTLYYELGRINAFVATTPSYSLAFDIRKGKFSYLGAQGKYSADLNPELKAKLRELREGILAAIEKYNPLNLIMDTTNRVKDRAIDLGQKADEIWDDTTDKIGDVFKASTDVLKSFGIF